MTGRSSLVAAGSVGGRCCVVVETSPPLVAGVVDDESSSVAVPCWPNLYFCSLPLPLPWTPLPVDDGGGNEPLAIIPLGDDALVAFAALVLLLLVLPLLLLSFLLGGHACFTFAFGVDVQLPIYHLSNQEAFLFVAFAWLERFPMKLASGPLYKILQYLSVCVFELYCVMSV
jgi:hypothetical protein